MYRKSVNLIYHGAIGNLGLEPLNISDARLEKIKIRNIELHEISTEKIWVIKHQKYKKYCIVME